MSKSTHSPLSWGLADPPSAPHGAVASGGCLADALAPRAPVLTAAARDALGLAFQEVMAQGLHGLCFSPYVDGQGPGTVIGEAQIRDRMEVIRPHARWVRSFSCTEGNELIPRIAKECGLKTLVGAWLGSDRAINEREIEGVIEVARAGQADIVAVGNEVLLREDLGEDELLACIERVKTALPGVPVGYVDAYYLFELHPRVAAACDVVLANCYPFWEGCPLDQAIGYMKSMVKRAVATAGGKQVIISETGWPDLGTAFHGAVPSRDGAMRYFVDTCHWARDEGVDLFYFAAFDEAWKVGAEGDVGAFWGLWDKDGRPKYA